MRSNREASIELVLWEEGEAPRYDRPWVTKWGVDSKLLARYLARGVTVNEVEELGREMATAVFRREWEDIGLDGYPSGLDYFVFDCSVFYGRVVPIGWLSVCIFGRDLYLSSDGERIGEMTNSLAPQAVELLIEKLTFLRRRRCRTEREWEVMRSVWTNRVNRVKKRALEMAHKVEQGNEEVGSNSSSTGELRGTRRS